MKNTNLLWSMGVDIGSTTAKIVVLDENQNRVYERYERHYSFVRQKALELVKDTLPLLENHPFTVAISGSAGLGVAKAANIPFVQEVYATGEIVRRTEPDTTTVIELGGEDAKILFFSKYGMPDERMNGSCAGGTGAFIDQMATLLDVDADTLDKLSLDHQKIYPIASRCGVFAKTDIQPLLNQGARKEDIAASIFQAVVNQTIAGLARGHKIEGKVMFLGGPLYYCKGLRARFKETLGLDDEHAIFPEYGRFAVAMGTAHYSQSCPATGIHSLIAALAGATEEKKQGNVLPPLFSTQENYDAFRIRHAKNTVPTSDITGYKGNAYLGIDCGSTTTKLTLISQDNEILYTYYDSNRGNPVEIIREQLKKIYMLTADSITIRAGAVTGYGEELIRRAFGCDFGIVETLAHYRAAKHFNPAVNFILDIGGQDIKCFRIKNGAIDSILLNEACSSGCGSFIETFARSMGYPIAEFAKLGLYAKAPVDLGSRCTVFMNSSVKQAQKDGADVGDISAGLSISVVKNALYKVIRASSADELGDQVVVQGGTFLNDAILRSFEIELGKEVIRPSIAGLMGAFGAALYAKHKVNKNPAHKSTLITPEALENFTHTSRTAICQACGNHCNLTINTFAGGERFISGNRCEKGLGIKVTEKLPNLYEFKTNYLTSLMEDQGQPIRGTIGLPLALGMYELAPFWHSIFKTLGFRVVLSKLSDRTIYEKGQFSIPSDTACYPAKLMHGHIEWLLEQKPDAIFSPCLTYNVNEHAGENHYNCPVVAYYPEVLRGNMESLSKVTFLYPYLNINDEKVLAKSLAEALAPVFGKISISDIRKAIKRGNETYENYMRALSQEGVHALRYAKENGKRVMILAGRPYHTDPEICHGIDRLASSLGFVVVSEDSIFTLSEPKKVNVLNQWTYHSRLYRSAEYAANNPGVELVQLVSFGCGIDAVTTDEVRTILENRGKLYTQIKIDEITNLGAVKIRLRSLVGALDEKEG
ncbi:MAG: 2-hydroxyglutaryl-CoA dehydratase [Ruminococcaceae bacterium]|nr:2-hydroxyglutaryl-CoA dehydratase [Oscillospiraceae bacterium]